MADVILFVLAAALVIANLGIVRAVSRLQRDVEGVLGVADELRDATWVQYDDRDIRDRMASLQLVVGEAVSQRERNDRRIEAVVRRAQKELREHGLEHGGLEAEAHELQLVDAGGGEEDQVRDVPDPVDRSPDDALPSGIPGMTRGQRRELTKRRQRG